MASALWWAEKDETYPGLCELDVIREADTAADARTIAARIAQMMADGYPVRDAEPGKPAPASMTISVFCCAAVRTLRCMKLP